MSDIVESAKNSMNAAVSRISWEAQKQLRIRSKQSEIDTLLKQRQQLIDDLAQVTMRLYQQGMLPDAQLSRLCASVMELDHDVKNREAQMQDLTNEAYPANQFAPAPTMNYAPPSPPPAPPYTPGGGASTASPTCPTCGNPVRANALYCRNCGTKLR
jgi:uncharacterized protein YdcH (DUF465 family)